MDGIRFAFGTLTVLPVRVRRWDRGAARAGMLWAPLAGLVRGARRGGASAGRVSARRRGRASVGRRSRRDGRTGG
ncbi:hypothetical protein GA0115252_13231, partial [Streptomyces sp. DfronAA-171]